MILCQCCGYVNLPPVNKYCNKCGGELLNLEIYSGKKLIESIYRPMSFTEGITSIWLGKHVCDMLFDSGWQASLKVIRNQNKSTDIVITVPFGTSLVHTISKANKLIEQSNRDSTNDHYESPPISSPRRNMSRSASAIIATLRGSADEALNEPQATGSAGGGGGNNEPISSGEDSSTQERI